MTYCPHCNFYKAKSVYNSYTKKRLGNTVLFSSSQNWSAWVISFDRKNNNKKHTLNNNNKSKQKSTLIYKFCSPVYMAENNSRLQLEDTEHHFVSLKLNKRSLKSVQY